MRNILFAILTIIIFSSQAQENFVPQKFYLHTQGELLRQHLSSPFGGLRGQEAPNPVFQPRYVAVDSAFIAQRKEQLQVVIHEVGNQKLVIYERRKQR